MARARARGITTAFAVRGFGYYEPRYFERRRSRLHVQPVPDRPLSRHGRTRQHAARAADRLVGRRRAGRVARVRDVRQPVAAQGPAAVRAARRHARIATARHSDPRRAVGTQRRLAERDSGHRFQPIPANHGGAAGAPPADYFALTRILLVPSVWEEPFGRVAAEAMINAIPPLVSNRGSLPHVVGGDFSDGGGGRVLPIPEWMTEKTTRLPSEEEVEPWYDAVCALWDDPALYHAVATRARSMRGRAIQRGGLAKSTCGLLHIAQTRRLSPRLKRSASACIRVKQGACRGWTKTICSIRVAFRFRSARRTIQEMSA